MNCCTYDCHQGRECPARKLTEADLDRRNARPGQIQIVTEEALRKMVEQGVIDNGQPRIMPAEAATEIGADDEPLTLADQAWLAGAFLAALLVLGTVSGYLWAIAR